MMDGRKNLLLYNFEREIGTQTISTTCTNQSKPLNTFDRLNNHNKN